MKTIKAASILWMLLLLVSGCMMGGGETCVSKRLFYKQSTPKQKENEDSMRIVSVIECTSKATKEVMPDL